MSRQSLPLFLAIIIAVPAWAAPRLKPEKNKDVLPIAGSRWFGRTAEGVDMTIDFTSDGKLTVAYSGRSFNTASWRQEGEKIYYEMNNRYCEFDGKLSGDTIVGSTHNVAGKTWETQLTRVTGGR
jgi:hypothetical protein